MAFGRENSTAVSASSPRCWLKSSRPQRMERLSGLGISRYGKRCWLGLVFGQFVKICRFFRGKKNQNWFKKKKNQKLFKKKPIKTNLRKKIKQTQALSACILISYTANNYQLMYFCKILNKGRYLDRNESKEKIHSSLPIIH